MKNSKNLWTILLMSSSIVLLLVLQALWLSSAYRDQLESLKKETSALFRNTVMDMQDSLILKTMEPVEGDSTRIHIYTRGVLRDSLKWKVPFEPGLPSRVSIRDSVSQIQIYVSATGSGDSVKEVLRPIVSEFRKSRQPGNFVFRIGHDSLKIAEIQNNYAKVLSREGILLPPRVVRINRPESPNKELKDGFFTDPLFFPHTPSYIAYFDDIRPTLLAKIGPQILFSLVLTLLTIAAFFVMYQSIRSQQRLMQLKNDLISNITHELKTPVATVSVALEALKNFKALDNPQLTHEYLEIAQNELGRLTLMTDKILRTAIFEENGIDLRMEPVDLEKAIQQVMSSLKLVFEKHQAVVDFQKEGTHFTLDGSAAHLTNIIYNLLDNALKYSQPGCQITLRLLDRGNKFRLSVEDNGTGIPVEYQKKVFEKFFRVPSGDVHNTKGYGLGLSYVMGVVKAHRGDIWVESEPGKGSKFIVEMPK